MQYVLEKLVTFERNSDTHVLNPGCKYDLNMAYKTPLHIKLEVCSVGAKLFSNLLSTIKSLVYDTKVFKIHRTITLPVVLYGSNTWSLTLRDERRLRVFENRVLRRVFGPKRDELRGEWRKLHNEELSDLYALPNMVRVVKSKRMRWAGHVARMGRGELCTGFWWGNLRDRDHWGDPDVDGRILLTWILRKWGGELWGLDGVGSG